ncbi:hypothetical protein F2Q69_00002022 [Brassica cretica]|uniref:Uncharacterized protein n=1 Tax=Brassica cretica TaxID=69181 RepID=A0A8S9PMR8_BRACR|nr:hypothetical protein F2Q69_00002022 [Brassica cretica]
MKIKKGKGPDQNQQPKSSHRLLLVRLSNGVECNDNGGTLISKNDADQQHHVFSGGMAGSIKTYKAQNVGK